MKLNAKLLFILISFTQFILAQTGTNLLSYGDQGELVYIPDSLGNTIPDFSYVGYEHGEVPIPSIPNVDTLSPNAGDNLQSIQAAIDEIQEMPLNGNGYRGALFLSEGLYEISGTIRITKSGVVLRGSGASTILTSTSTSQINLIELVGADGPDDDMNSEKAIPDSFVPIGARSFNIEGPHDFEVGDNIQLERLPNEAWINLLDVAQYGWSANGYKLKYKRQIVGINGNNITIDAPVVDPIDMVYSAGSIYKYTWDGVISNCSVENIRLESSYTSDEDENHAWNAIWIQNAKNCWINNVQAYYFGYSCVNIKRECYKITVSNCENWEPKSRTTGGRKYSFNVEGQQCLFKNCKADKGRHDYVSGSRIPGPNVFLRCTATNQLSTIGPHHRWSTGQLYDNVSGTDVFAAENRTSSGSGHGWAGSQIMFWNCTTTDDIILQDPPSSHINWAIGCIANSFSNESKTGERAIEPFGYIESSGAHVPIESLYEKQLCDRLGNCPLITNEEKIIINNIKIYPNPISNQINIEGYEGAYVLYNLQGQKISEGITYGTIELNHELPSNLYILVLDGNMKFTLVK